MKKYTVLKSQICYYFQFRIYRLLLSLFKAQLKLNLFINLLVFGNGNLCSTNTNRKTGKTKFLVENIRKWNQAHGMVPMRYKVCSTIINSLVTFEIKSSISYSVECHHQVGPLTDSLSYDECGVPIWGTQERGVCNRAKIPAFTYYKLKSWFFQFFPYFSATVVRNVYLSIVLHNLWLISIKYYQPHMKKVANKKVLKATKNISICKGLSRTNEILKLKICPCTTLQVQTFWCSPL